MKKDCNMVEVKFYYNSSNDYPDTGRTEKDIEHGHYLLCKTIKFDNVNDNEYLKNVLTEDPYYEINKSELIKYKSFVNCLCIIYINNIEKLRFTYSDSDDKYRLCNGKLIRRNKVYDDFCRFILFEYINNDISTLK